MEQEFFFPQNVRTHYKLWVFGPKQLRRMLAGLPALLLVGGFLVYKLPLAPAMILGSAAAACYVAAWCWPVFSDEQTVLDLALHLYRRRLQQTAFPYMEEVPRERSGWSEVGVEIPQDNRTGMASHR